MSCKMVWIKEQILKQIFKIWGLFSELEVANRVMWFFYLPVFTQFPSVSSAQL